jgi:hypothetical protein
MTTKCAWVSFFGSFCGILRVAVGCPRFKDEDPVDALETEVAKIIKKLAEARKVALAQLTLGLQQEAVAQPDRFAAAFRRLRSGRKTSN